MVVSVFALITTSAPEADCGARNLSRLGREGGTFRVKQAADKRAGAVHPSQEEDNRRRGLPAVRDLQNVTDQLIMVNSS
jgi:hypothetical protein